MDLVVALNTGHGGALSTVHANGAADALRRLEMLASMSGVRVAPDVVREQLTGALDRIVHIERRPDGSRVAVSVSEVVRTAGTAAVRELWRRSEKGAG